MKKTAAFLVAGLTAASSISPAFAASEDAWEALAKDVQTACLKAGSGLFEKARAVVDPHGSESYGLALLRGKAKGADANISVICVYDKETKKAEVGGELPAKKK